MPQDVLNPGGDEPVSLAQLTEAAEPVLSFDKITLAHAEESGLLEMVAESARGEARHFSDSLEVPIDALNRTLGMRERCITPIVEMISQWKRLRANYLLKAEGFKADLSFVDNFDSEVRKAEIESEKKITAVEDRYETNTGYSNLKRAAFSASKNYDEYYVDYKRVPTLTSWPIYWGAMAIVFSLDFFVNYYTFLYQYKIVYNAIGHSVAIAILIALAAHFHGTYLRQMHYHFGATTDGGKRRGAILVFVIWVVFLFIAIGSVAWSRYIWGMSLLEGTSDIEPNIVSDDVRPVINVWQTVTNSTIANVLLYAIGLGIAWLAHDENPEFARALQVKEAAIKKFEKVERKFRSEIDTLQQSMAKEKERLRTRKDTVSARLIPVRALEASVLEKARELKQSAQSLSASLLSSYQRELTTNLQGSAVFVSANGERTSVQKYRGLSLSIAPSELEGT